VKVKASELREQMYDNFDALVSKTLIKEDYEQERAEYDAHQYDKTGVFERVDMGEEDYDAPTRPLRMMSLEHEQEVVDADRSGSKPSMSSTIDNSELKTGKGEPTPLDRRATQFHIEPNELRRFWMSRNFDDMMRYLTEHKVGTNVMNYFVHDLNNEFNDFDINRLYNEWYKYTIEGETEAPSIPSKGMTTRSKTVSSRIPTTKRETKTAAAASIQIDEPKEGQKVKTKATRKSQMDSITQQLHEVEKQMKEPKEPAQEPKAASKIPTRKATGAASRVVIPPPPPALAPKAAGRPILAYDPSLPPTDKANENRIKSLKSLIGKNTSGDASLKTYREKYISQHGQKNWDALFKAAM
jgi:hypothetical protein